MIDKQTRSIVATVLTVTIAFISWMIVQTKKEHPPENCYGRQISPRFPGFAVRL